MSVDPITCHILDTTSGSPASDVLCQIFLISSSAEDQTTFDLPVGSTPKPFAMNKTDKDGRIKKWILDPQLESSQKADVGVTENTWSTLKPGIYRVKFYTGKYFSELKDPQRTFFPFVEITFMVQDPPDNHYHIPLLLSNHSYTTYRGS
ncbi:predicted protein [Scheffersomyces stipitis CBS 6054]|uniref:5-hydroxyisourate hydrolase n=1 Tax=Scheffersomyces stipitis (strain ATCC 58785 / CBS 6054 / NBRC 10063 / NRRL Y-11545) TaxID=322104 RepID=A3LTS2_PICST|nr:predicted protein [Scheffersomyces stipitis CBS 6054]ABN66465.2 predicted protein [Scheffersomyces stipitis CBS 6054]KAG2733209.1 hypothetical protein G9P44_004199 [Scheffersomyces stipitis]